MSLSCLFSIGLLIPFLMILLGHIRGNSRGGKPLPPGPPKLPLIGNLYHVGMKRQWEIFTKWRETYDSDILHISGLGLDFLILNSYKSAVDLLGSRSAIYSSRPYLPLLHDLTGLDYVFIFMPYGKRWRKSRQMLVRHLSPDTSKDASVKALSGRAEAREQASLQRLLLRLLDCPEDFINHIKEFTHTAGLLSMYGVATPSLIASVSSGVKILVSFGAEVLNVGGFLCTFVPILDPILDRFPEFSSKKAIEKIRRSVASVKEVPFEEAHSAWKSGLCDSSFISNALDNALARATPLSEEDMKQLSEVASTSLIAFAATSSSTITGFILAMVLHPGIQRAAQEEVDRVLDGRLPTRGDLNSMPYVTALFREILRWFPPLPLGAPHLVIQEDSYREFFIKKDTIVVANQWAMCRDENYYPNAGLFKPERFLKEDGQMNPNILDPGEIVFGHGRRVCPGRDIAELSIRLAMASILAVFDIGRASDEHGQSIEPRVGYGDMPHFNPPNFPCKIVPRTLQVVELIQGRSR